MHRAARYCFALITSVALAIATAGPVNAASGDESGFVSRINRERSSRGLSTLSWSEELAVVARRHSREMAEQNDLHHNSNLRNEVSGWQVVGENVGYGPNVDALHDAFMRSASHRANILDHEYTQIGVGTVWMDGTLWVTEVFRLPSRTRRASSRMSSPARRRMPRRSTSVSRPAGQPAIPPRRSVAPAATPPAASDATASDLTRLMVHHVLAGDDPAVASIYPAELYVAEPSDAHGSMIAVSFLPFAQIVNRVNRGLLER